MDTPTDVGGFQFDVTQVTLGAASGGLAEQYGFEVSTSELGIVIGFSLETENLIDSAKSKLKDKSCDWIIANEHFNGKESVFNSEMNSVKFIDKDSFEEFFV